MKYLVFCLLICPLLQAQKYLEPDKIKQFNITVNQDDQIVKTQILKNPAKIHLNNEATYTWYTNNQLLETKGGYDGKLLHGYYKAFFFSNQLKESGSIRYGLRNKEWRYWYSNGMLREIITWKKGKKSGTYKLYNDQGKLMASGRFKDDLLHGKFRTYDNYGRVAETKRYKHGNEIVKAPKIKKERKIRPEKQKKPKKIREKPSADPEAPVQPPQDTLKKGNFFKHFFKKKKKETKPEITPSGVTA